MRVRTLIAALLLSLFSGCASEPTLSSPDPDASPQVVQARQLLSDELSRAPFIKGVVFVTDPGDPRVMNYTDANTGEAKTITLVTLLPASISISYSPSPNAYTEPAWKISYDNYQDRQSYFWLWSGWSQADAQQIADALKVVVVDARRDADALFAAKYQKFLGLCQTYIDSKTMAPFPEEARQHQLLAEDAANRNDLNKALDEYDKVIDAAPCSAESRRRDAQLLAQDGWYLVAIQNMKKYLALIPDAPDAQAIRDQILVWNGRMGAE